VELRWLLGERDLSRRGGDARSFAEADVAFHRAVFRMSGNRLAAAGAELAGPVMLGQMLTNALVIAADDHLQSLHARLTDAIEARRPSRARRAARAIAAREGEEAARPP
jgi:DNA-binding FadR family transcriptional regulator